MAKSSSRLSKTAKPKSIICPYCQGKGVIKYGKRAKKLEKVQILYCKNCEKKFTIGTAKFKTFPLRVILAVLSLYNEFYTKEQIADFVKKKYRLKISGQNIANWLKDYGEYLPFLRMREFAAKKYSRREAIVRSRMFHGQIYDFGFHRAKMDCILEEEYRHYKFRPLREYLELVLAECPHQVFKDNPFRASEYKDIFNLDGVRVTRRENRAVDIARLVLEAVENNKERHQFLQNFMLANDSVTVGVEVPILLTPEDIFHYQKMLGFKVPLELKESEALTGHIDLVQIRNGAVHLLDFKPSARKEKPIAQLTLYALALSRLTSLRLYHFKCGWFDGEDYFEFYPLHVVYKKNKGRAAKSKLVGRSE